MNKPKIKLSPNGSIKITSLNELHFKKQPTQTLENGKALLCGCGASKKIPYCDGMHAKAKFTSKKSEQRVVSKDKNYYGEEITVHFDLAACAHVGVCIRKLPQVFDVHKRPWINSDGATVEEIIKIVRACPAGALSYTLKDQERVDSFDSEAKVIVNHHGWIEVWGGIELEGAEAPKVQDHYILCGCGKSKNHPYCDGAHWKKEEDCKTC
jgi:CDGSH-type Zn-finger protein/ferredoxin